MSRSSSSTDDSTWRFFRFKWFASEKNKLKTSEKTYGYTWVQLHAFREMTALPKVPESMPIELLPTNTNNCDGLSSSLERCIDKGIETERSIAPFARLHVCKPHWVRLTRCVRTRDEGVMRAVEGWEAKHVASMTGKDREAYLEDLKTRMQYLEYVNQRSTDEEELYRLSKETNQLRRRL
eukprot:GDKI01040576.1.p2 GENE.GDKI01040576.1~~GDKI01040576.1.p2  ORF type:complete len:180 (+),score=58.21 GDKI01040576.1:98-637(+)